MKSALRLTFIGNVVYLLIGWLTTSRAWRFVTSRSVCAFVSLTGCFISAVAVILAVVNMAYDVFDVSRVILLCCVLAVFSFNLAMYSLQRKAIG